MRHSCVAASARAWSTAHHKNDMFRWLLVIFFVLLIVNSFTSWFRKIGFGRLPGDLNFTLFGREFNLPFTTTIILSLVAAGIARIL